MTIVTVHNEEQKVDEYEFVDFQKAERFADARCRGARLEGIVFIVWTRGFPIHSSVSTGGGDEWIGEEVA